ncbi:9692_t:CDS:2, partial [Funneliformis caledonium]
MNQAINDTTSLQRTGTIENFHLSVVITALVLGHIDLITSSFVIYSAYKKWLTSSLSISSRVPLYLNMVFMPNFFYSLIYHKVIPETPCKLLAFLFFFNININMIVMAGVAIITYVRIVRRPIDLDLGKFD